MYLNVFELYVSLQFYLACNNEFDHTELDPKLLRVQKMSLVLESPLANPQIIFIHKNIQ